MIEQIREMATYCMNVGGLWGAGFLMALESMITPIPSEVVMPPLGMAVHRGEFSLQGAMIATSIGSLLGSLISYYMGYFGGKPFVMKIGKWLLINEQHLDLTHRWFERWGSLTVFVCRFVPVVRHLISIPAGMARMNILKFCIYTLLGATAWNGFLLWVGWKLEREWDTILQYRGPIDMVIIVALVVGVIAWYWVHLKKPKREETRV